MLAAAACSSSPALTADPSPVAAPPPALTALPEHAGLAARYPHDEGVRNDASVVFADDVETSVGELIPTGFAVDHGPAWNNRWDRAFGGVRITRDPRHVHSGKQAMEFSSDKPASLGVRKYLSEAVDRLFLRYYLKYDDAFPGAHHVGGTMAARASGVPDTNAGVKPDGTSQFDVVLDLWSFDRSVRTPGHLVAYVYHMDQQHQWGEQFYPSGRTRPATNGEQRIFGPTFLPREDIVPALGRWYCHEFMVQANTPGQRNGRVAFWVDGRLAADFPNLRFRTVSSLKIGRVGLALYETRNNGLHRVWIDDVVAATEYIGPLTPAR